MDRRLLAPLTLVLTIVIAGTAWAGSFSSADYQGRVESDHGTFIGFDLSKKNGVTKVVNVDLVVKLQCSNGESGQVLLQTKGSLRVKDNGSFAGTLRGGAQARGGGNPPTVRTAASGKLQRHGKVKGRVDVNYSFADSNRGGPLVHCYSGAVDWKAKRGAIVNPDVVMVPRLQPG